MSFVQNFHIMNTEHRYKLASNKVKKLDCPHCGAKKHWQRYIDTETGEILPDEYGKCDNENKCGEWKPPPLETICYFVPADEIKEISDKAIVIKQGKNEQTVPKKAVFEQTSDGLYLAEYFLKDTTGKRNSPLTIKYNETDCKAFNSEGEAVFINKTKAVKRPKPQPDPVYFDVETFKQTLQPDRYQHNTFIQNLLLQSEKDTTPFAANDVFDAINMYQLGTVTRGDMAGSITFPFIDIQGNVRTIQVKQFDANNKSAKDINPNKLDKVIISNLKKENRAVPEWLTKYIEYGDECGYFTCLFGEHLLSKYPDKPIALVEAPKTAIYCTLYFKNSTIPLYKDCIWLAVYNKSSFSFKKATVLQGRFVYVFPDLSKDGSTFKDWETKAKNYESQLPGTRFIMVDLLEKTASQEQKTNASDIADFLMQMDWNHTHEPPPPPKPEPPRHTPQQQSIIPFEAYIESLHFENGMLMTDGYPASWDITNIDDRTKKFVHECQHNPSLLEMTKRFNLSDG